MNTVDWKLALQLSLFGLVMAIATVFWIPSTIEPAFWLVIFVICAIVVAKKRSSGHFFQGFVISLMNCVWITSAHAIFADAYLARHPQEAAMMSNGPMHGSPQLMMLIFGPIVGVVSGIVLGLFCLVASKIVKKA